MVFKYINVIDENFDVSLFTESELDNLEAMVEFNQYRLMRGASLRFVERHVDAKRDRYIKLPKYAPPSSEKSHLLNTFDIYSHTRKHPKKPELPICLTNTALCNYVHKRYIYQQHLSEQLRRQYSYHMKNVLQNVKAIKHSYDVNLSRKNSLYLRSH